MSICAFESICLSIYHFLILFFSVLLKTFLADTFAYPMDYYVRLLPNYHVCEYVLKLHTIFFQCAETK